MEDVNKTCPENVNDVYRKIGQNLKKYRLLRGYSQEDLAEILGANEKYIGHVERFERYVGLKKLIKLSFILEIELKDLFDFKEIDNNE